MKNERLLNAIGMAEDKFVEEAMPAAAKANAQSAFDGDGEQGELVTAPAKKRFYGGWIAGAACLCIAVGGLALWGFSGGNGLAENTPAAMDTDSDYSSYPQENGYYAVPMSEEMLGSFELRDFVPKKLPTGFYLEDSTYFVNESGYGTAYINYSNGEDYIYYIIHNDPSDTAIYGDSPMLDINLAVEHLPIADGSLWVNCGEVKLGLGVVPPDSVSEGELYEMIRSIGYLPQDIDITEEEYAVVYLSLEELYNCQWRMFVPRFAPEGYEFADKASYERTLDSSTVTYRFREQESGNTIEFVFITDYLDGSFENEELKASKLTISDMAKVKSGQLIYCENGFSALRVNIDNPQLVADGELFRALLSVPYYDFSQNSEITAVDLTKYIGAGDPGAAFEHYYDIQRVNIRTKFNQRDSFLPFFDQKTYDGGGLDGDFGTIVGFDGKNVYFESTGTVDSMDENGNTITLAVTSIGMYDIQGDSYKQLVRYYDSDVEFICADGEFIYYTVSGRDGNNVLHSDFCRRNINDPIYGTVDNSPLLSVDGEITGTAVNGSFIYLALISDGQYSLVCFDMNEDVEADIAANRLYVSMIEIPDSVESIMPYKDGAAYNLKNDTRSFRYWNGEQESKEELLFTAKADYEIYSDGEIFYTVTDGQLYTGDDSYEQPQDKQFFDALDIWGLSVSDRVTLAYNNAVDINPLYKFDNARDIASADGLIVPSSHMGIIYDAKRGWFTHPDPDKNYQSRSSAGGSLLMLEEEDEFITGEPGDYITLCIITRK